jgi:hypothetical protein
MTTQATINWPQLYEQDEVAWLDAMAAYAASGQAEKLDLVSLQDYLESGADSDRREVRSRLRALIEHHLLWEAQPELRTREWLGQMCREQMELVRFIKPATLAQFAEEVLQETYREALSLFRRGTGKPIDRYPELSPLSAQGWLAIPIPFTLEEVSPLTTWVAR